MEATIGRIVLYTLTADDAAMVNRRRNQTAPAEIRERIKAGTWPVGAQAHIGNQEDAGSVRPMLVVRIWDAPIQTINGQVLLDGNDTLWVTSVAQSAAPEPGKWHWPVRV